MDRLPPQGHGKGRYSPASLGRPHTGSTVVSEAIDTDSELLILLLSRGPRDAGSEPHPSSMMHWPDN